MPRDEWEFTDGDATRGVDVGSGRVADVPACRLQQPVDIPLACCSGCGAKTSPFCYLPNLRTSGRMGEPAPASSQLSQHLIHFEYCIDALPVPVVFEIGGMQTVFQ